MTRLRGRSPRGKRLHASAPCGCWLSTTMSGAVRQDGSTACMTVEGAVNAEIFRSYVREVLLPTMRAGDILVMDNLITDKDQESLRAFFSPSVMLFQESHKKMLTIDLLIVDIVLSIMILTAACQLLEEPGRCKKTKYEICQQLIEMNTWKKFFCFSYEI